MSGLEHFRGSGVGSVSSRAYWVEKLSRFVGDYAGNAGGYPVEITETWIDQFPAASQTPLLQALAETLQRTYIRRDDVRSYFTESITNRDFWRNAHVCRGAARGKSHELTTKVVLDAIDERLGADFVADDATQWHTAKHHVFIDDAVFTGSRVKEDYGQWWTPQSSRPKRRPQDGPLRIYFWTYLLHTAGKQDIEGWVDRNLRRHGYDVTISFVSRLTYEDRDQHRDVSDVLWPSVMTETAGRSGLHLATRPDRLRSTGPGTSAVFPDAGQRRILESELLDASVEISRRLEAPWTPLGYGRKPFGFGSLSVSYRNCPNNAPIALWWNTEYWSPLFPRTTYAHQEAAEANGNDGEVPF